MGEVHADFKFQLVVLRLHVAAQLIERLVMGALFQMGQLMHHDHAQKGFWCFFEQGGDAYFALGFELAALHPRDTGVGAQSVLYDMQFAVENHLVQRLCTAQVQLLQILHVLVKRPVGAYRVTLWVARLQPGCQTRRDYQFLHLLQGCAGISLKVFERQFCF